MTLVRLSPTFEVFEGLTKDEQSWEMARAYGICNGWRVNFAFDSGGKSFGVSGSSADVSSDLDRLLLGKLRSLSDVIVTSGLTARVEKYRSSKHAPIAIFTSSGDLDDVPAIQGTQYFTPLVLTSKSKVAEIETRLSDVDVLVAPYEPSQHEDDWPMAIAKVLQHEGYQSPILESGLTTLREFFRARVIDEVCISVTHPRHTGVSARDLGVQHIDGLLGNFKGFSLRYLFTDGQSTYSCWRRGSGAS